MANGKYKGVDKATARLALRVSKLARQALADPKLANNLKNKIIKGIRETHMLPSGSPVPDVSTEWKMRRSQLSSINKTHKDFQVNGSNMTFTGQFLNSFQAKIQRFGVSTKLIVYPTGIHKGYNLVYGGQSDSVFNVDIARGFLARGVDYRNVSLENKNKLVKTVKARVLKEFKLNL